MKHSIKNSSRILGKQYIYLKYMYIDFCIILDDCSLKYRK